MRLAAHTTEPMTFYNALETTPFGFTHDVYEFSLFEDILNGQLGAKLQRLLKILEFNKLLLGRSARLLEVSQKRFCCVLQLTFAEAQLDGIIAIAFFGLDLRHHARPSLDNRTRQSLPVSVV